MNDPVSSYLRITLISIAVAALWPSPEASGNGSVFLLSGAHGLQRSGVVSGNELSVTAVGIHLSIHNENGLSPTISYIYDMAEGGGAQEHRASGGIRFHFLNPAQPSVSNTAGSILKIEPIVSPYIGSSVLIGRYQLIRLNSLPDFSAATDYFGGQLEIGAFIPMFSGFSFLLEGSGGYVISNGSRFNFSALVYRATLGLGVLF